MRPRIVEALEAYFGAGLAGWLVPNAPLMYAVALLAVTLLFVRRSGGSRLDRVHALSIALWAMLGGLAGTRVFHLAENLPATLADPARIFDPAGRVASWGAYLGGALAVALYGRRQRLEVVPYLDVLASSAGLGIFIGRSSCFLNGDDFGIRSDLPWAVCYPHASYPFVDQVQRGLLDPLAELSLPLHPVQLYLALNGLALFLLASRVWVRFRHRPGVTFASFWLMYGATRFLWELLRGDQPHDVLGVFTTAQVVALLVALVSAVGLGLSLFSSAERAAGSALLGDTLR